VLSVGYGSKWRAVQKGVNCMKAKCVLLLVVLIPAALWAQGDRGTITGTVTDPANAVVPGAKVIVKNMDTGATWETVTTGTGNYTVPALPIGQYEVTVEAAGFKRTSQPGVRVEVAQTVRIDIGLQLGATTETVTVTAETPLLRTENAEQSINVNRDRINALPLNFGGGGGSTGNIRNWMSFIVLAPGVNGTTGSPQTASVNGLPGGMVKILVEGMDVSSSNDSSWTSIVAASSIEAIGEFSLQTSNFSAQYPGGLGAMFNFTTRSGTNELHGSVYDYFTNETVFDAHRHFLASRRDRSRKHDGGGTIGGPIYIPKLYNGKDRTFFFFNFEAFRNKSVTYGQRGTVPTDAMRKGDFSAILTNKQLTASGQPAFDGLGRAILENTIYDISTERNVGGVLYRDPFPNNIIPQTRLDPVALKIQDLFPKPSNSELINNWNYDLVNPRVQNLPSLKLDHNIGYDKKLSFYWSYQSTRDIPGNDPLPYPISGKRDKTATGNTLRLNWDQSITPTFLARIGVGFLRFHNPDSAVKEVLNYDAVGKLGLRGSVTNPAGFPRITGIGSGTYGGMNFNLGPSNANDYYNDKLTVNVDTTYIRGSHTYKLGAQWGNEMWSDRNTRGSQGIYNFATTQTSQPALQGFSLSGGSVGFGYASFMLGLVSSASVNAVQDPQWRKNTWALYLQDNWKATRRLTLDMGIRWDLQGQGHEIHWRNSMFGPGTPNPNAGGRPGAVIFEGFGPGRIGGQFTDTYPYAIGPRIGAAYQINDKTVFRAGWGFSYGQGPNWWYVTNQTLRGVGFDVYNTPSPAFAQPALYLKNGLEGMYDRNALYRPTLDPGSGLTPGTVASTIGNYYDRNGGRPQRINQWNIALQRELFRTMSLEAAYVGNRGVWLEANQLWSLNVMSTEYLKSRGLDINNAADRALLTSNLSSSAVKARGFDVPYPGYPTNRTLAQSLRPFPHLTSSVTPVWAPLGNSWYDSLQVKFTKRYSHGLDVSASYTWSKALARGTGGSNAAALGGGVNDQFNRVNQKSLASNDRPQILTVAFSYQTPRVTTNRIVRAITGDWVFAGLLRYQSGNLFSVPGSLASGIGNYTFQGNTRMNRVNTQPLFNVDKNKIDPNRDVEVLNRAAWQDVGQGQWGFSAPYYRDYRWLRLINEDMNMGRVFPFKENGRMRLTVRVEFFNVFNRVRLPAPTSGNPTQTTTYDSQGRVTSGWGFINTINGINGARNGQGVIRFEF